MENAESAYDVIVKFDGYGKELLPSSNEPSQVPTSGSD